MAEIMFIKSDTGYLWNIVEARKSWLISANNNLYITWRSTCISSFQSACIGNHQPLKKAKDLGCEIHRQGISLLFTRIKDGSDKSPDEESLHHCPLLSLCMEVNGWRTLIQPCNKNNKSSMIIYHPIIHA